MEINENITDGKKKIKWTDKNKVDAVQCKWHKKNYKKKTLGLFISKDFMVGQQI